MATQSITYSIYTHTHTHIGTYIMYNIVDTVFYFIQTRVIILYYIYVIIYTIYAFIILYICVYTRCSRHDVGYIYALRNRSVCNCRYTAQYGEAVYFMYVIFRFRSCRLFKLYGLFLKHNIYCVASTCPGLTLTNIYDPRFERTGGRGTASVDIVDE